MLIFYGICKKCLIARQKAVSKLKILYSGFSLIFNENLTKTMFNKNM
ncbi:hypothetical protein CHAB381_1130 [Campylobacter hominis ATCC BAA-381]|uniref:Uncharacterized protein n=1 Tax=Campylobacter hominis (strain ATCC BAA-381 / DSM 21671 / CCUG 45161 / LMG 19568 / NCTC 13146 / CH001A) TaxID=360107 RepID=A7I2E5_CAMHC|nr:hypothetical protein CHAB381_1130 [Campylobacter hominis ATCC BAA-381]